MKCHVPLGPSDVKGAAGNVVLRAPAKDDRVGDGKDGAPKPKGALAAETTLGGDGIQDLAEQILDLLKAAVGCDLKFRVRVELGGDTPPDPDAVARIDALLAEASEDWTLK